MILNSSRCRGASHPYFWIGFVLALPVGCFLEFISTKAFPGVHHFGFLRRRARRVAPISDSFPLEGAPIWFPPRFRYDRRLPARRRPRRGCRTRSETTKRRIE